MRVLAALLSLLTDVWREWRCHHDWAEECDPPACVNCGRVQR